MKKALPRPRGRPVDLEKRQAMLDAASRLFLRRGFAGTSMDAVAAEAGVSKLTVYAHFANKDNLFQAVVRARCDAYNQPERFADYVDLPPRRALTEMGSNFLALLLDPEVLRLHAMITAESARRPKIARLFYKAGPEQVTALFVEYFRRAAARGALALDDPAVAADQFLALLRGDLHFRATLKLRPRPSPGQVREQVDRTVKLFLRAYGRR